MKRRRFTLTELVLVVAIIAILAALLMPAIMQSTNSNTKKTAVYKCVKTYVTGGDGAQKRVDMKPQTGGLTETFRCDNTYGVRNSATLYAQFEAGKWYSVSTVGDRDEFWSRFPYVTSVSEVPDPNPQ